MEFFKKQTSIDFLGWKQKRIGFAISLGLILLSIVLLATRGLNFGIDFTGGTLVELGYPQAVEPQSVRDVLRGTEFDDALVQSFGTDRDILIRIAPREGAQTADISNEVIALLQAAGHDPDLRRVEFVGPQVGEELTEDGGLAMLFALFGILIYVGLRFEAKLALGSVAALVHDVIIVLGFFSLTQMNFDLTVLAAILAVIGYSLNDTIVVFDRVRENFRKLRKDTPIQVFNKSINQMLGRTVMTSGTTLLVLFSLLILGGEAMTGFAAALIVGIVVGTYSSIYTASAMAILLGVDRQNLIPVPKEGAEQPDVQP